MKWLRGYISCYVKAGHWERFMNLCRHHGIKLWNIEIHEGTVSFCMFSRDFRQLNAFVGKTRVAPHIIQRKGLPFIVENAMRNWTFTFGLVLFFAVLKFLSLFVWQINYYGQQEYTKESISKDVTELGVYTGMFRKNLNCDNLERSLRECYENMSWVSAEEKGCVLNIKIKEGNAEKKKEEQEIVPCHLISPCDGKIQSIITKEGTAKARKGDDVKKGDILISGIVEIKDDSGETVRLNGVQADGEITILTEEKTEDSINIQYMDKNKTGKNINVYTVEINGKRFSIKNPLKWFDNSANYVIINNICADRKFIPWDTSLKITRRTFMGYEKVKKEYSEKEAAEILKKRFSSKLMEYGENGFEVVNQSLDIKKDKKMYKAYGTIRLSVSEMDRTEIKSEELLLENKGKEDADGTGGENS